jgi:hypothetical protein
MTGLDVLTFIVRIVFVTAAVFSEKAKAIRMYTWLNYVSMA